MRYLEISTPYRDNYLVNEQGHISRDRYGEKPDFSGQWIMRGVISVKAVYGPVIPLQQLFDMDLESIQWRYKNGNPRYTVVDLDYGTTRVWGNTRYHGIRYIRMVERD